MCMCVAVAFIRSLALRPHTHGTCIRTLSAKAFLADRHYASLPCKRMGKKCETTGAEEEREVVACNSSLMPESKRRKRRRKGNRKGRREEMRRSS